MLKNVVCLAAVMFALAVPVIAQSKLEPPVPVRTVAPDYPEDLKREGVAGLVVVQCTIDAQGNVDQPQVQKSSNKEFEQPAIDAIKRWKFKPAKLDGNPVARKVSIPIKFVTES
ncbi:MAG TPA: energy transducer TonB [Opitutaceae bacterium]|nr:energy transducer TonB [Opitutaceae bacterium]